MVLVDANVILDIATNDPRWFDWSRAQLEPLIDAGEAAISPIIYNEGDGKSVRPSRDAASRRRLSVVTNSVSPATIAVFEE